MLTSDDIGLMKKIIDQESGTTDAEKKTLKLMIDTAYALGVNAGMQHSIDLLSGVKAQ